MFHRHMISKKSPIHAHLCMQAHICRRTHRDHLPIQRHIEFLHTDTQAPASPPPTTTMVTVQTVPLKTQSQWRHIDIRLVPGAGICSLFFSFFFLFARINKCCGICTNSATCENVATSSFLLLHLLSLFFHTKCK